MIEQKRDGAQLSWPFEGFEIGDENERMDWSESGEWGVPGIRRTPEPFDLVEMLP